MSLYFTLLLPQLSTRIFISIFIKGFIADCLVAGHNDCVDNVVNCSSARQVVDRSCETLKDGAYRAGRLKCAAQVCRQCCLSQAMGKHKVLAWPATLLSGAFSSPTEGTIAASLWSSPSILRVGSICFASSVCLTHFVNFLVACRASC